MCNFTDLFSKLLSKDNIVIQCHDDPDADSIASGYSMYKFFESKNKDIRLIYSGNLKITKPNLIEMKDKLDIHIEHIDDPASFNKPDLLITVDCQYGSKNVTKINSEEIAIIDHHTKDTTLKDDINYSIIDSKLGSCSTLIWYLLEKQGFKVNENKDIATSLYYGLLTDTNNFTEISNPLDKDMRSFLEFDESLIDTLKYKNLALKDIETAGLSLLRCSHNSSHNFAVFKTEVCDPNLLGLISDLVITVNSIDTSVVFYQSENRVKFSVRSCIREVMANEMANYLADDLGGGGGHSKKAGGQINISEFINKHPHSNTASSG